MKWRRIEEAFVKGLMFASMGLVAICLTSILLVIVIRGAGALSFSMLVETPKGGYYLGKSGGIANAIVGSAYLALGGTVLAFALSLPIAFAVQQEYAGRRVASFTRLALDVLWGTPSIVYGAFGFVIMVWMGIRACLLGGILVLALLMMPIMARTFEEVIRMVPRELKEASYAMGATRWETTWAIVARQAVPGIVTGVMLAFGRGIGDAASLLFTAGYSDRIPHSLFDPVASLPLAVFFQIGTPIPEVQQRAYASALVLLIIVLLISLGSRFIGKRFARFAIR